MRLTSWKMGVLCLTFRTVGRQLVLRRGLLVLTLTLLVLFVLVAYSFMQYSVALQVVSQSVHYVDKLEQSDIPIVKKAGISALAKVRNGTEGKERPLGDVVIEAKSPPKETYSLEEEEKSVTNNNNDDDSTYLRLSGSEEECLFSSKALDNKPTINVLDVMESLPYDNKDGGVWKQGYDITYSEASFQQEPLQVFVVPHSHNDPGWLKTFEQYYNQDTRNILNNVVNALVEDSKRRFIWAEISFFELWWNEQPDDRRKLAKKLIDNGQLEIVTGGWVMNDEANTHYFAMVDQLMEGHQWLHDNVGAKPLSGWAIDPFGYTPTMAYLLQRMGFHNMLIQRTHYAIKKHFSQQKQLEYIWRQNWDHSGSTDMLCHMMPFYSYDVPHTCGPDPKICCQFDFKRLPGSRITCPWRVPAQHITGTNVKDRAMMILDQYRKKAQLYRTNVLLVPLGDDFRYDTSSEIHDQYNNYHKIFTYFNDHPELNVKGQFGTLNDYFTALRKNTGVSGIAHPSGFPSLVGDFFTYCDREVDYWSGYYTSRPFYKNLDRILEDRLRAAEIIYSLAVAQSVVLPAGLDDKLTRARRSLGLFQHHDGITGTAKNHVVVDYGNKLLNAVNGADHVMAAAAQALLLGDSQSELTASSLIFDVDETRAQHDSLPQKTLINLSSNEKRVVYLYNSLTHKRQEMITLLVDSVSASVYDASNNAISCQVNPVVTSDGVAPSRYELVFVAKMTPLSLTKYYIAGVTSELTTMATLTCSGNRPSSSLFKTSSIGSEPFFTLHTDHLAVTFDGSTGLLQSIKKKDSDNIIRTNIDFTLYSSYKSGAYLFLPNGGAQSIVEKSASYCVTEGPLLHQVQVTMPMINHIVQIANSPGVDGQSVYIMNTVDVRRESNKELVMKLSTSISNSDRIFYTDLNGFQTARRKTMDKLTTQGNFYPMPSYMFLQDTTSRVTLLTGQPLGVSSRETGVMEVVLDRRLSKDDARGLGHGVMDNKVTLSNFRLLVEHRNTIANNPIGELSYPSLVAHYTSSILVLPVHHFIAKPNSPSSTALVPSYTGLKDQLPCDVHMLNLRSIFNSGHREVALLLHRKGFDCGFSARPLTCRLTSGQVAVKEIFNSSPSSSVRTTLTMMYPVEDSTDHIDPMEITTNRLSWD